MYIMTFHSPVCLHVLAAHNSRFLPFPHRTVANFLLFLVNIDAIFVLFVSFLLPNASHFWILFPLFCHFTLTLHGVFSSRARLLHWNTSLGSVLHSQLLSPHPPTWVLLPHQRWPCLLMYTALVFIPCFTAGRLSSPFPQWRTPLPVLSHLPPLLPVSCLFHHKAVWSCPLFLSKWFLLFWGMSSFLLPPSQQPAILCFSLGSQQSFSAFPWPWLEPLGLSTGVCLLSHHFPQVLVPWLSPSLSRLLIPTVNRDSSLPGQVPYVSGLRGGTHRLPESFWLGGMSLSVWESLECPSGWLWMFGVHQKRDLSESHTATPLVRSHLVPGSVESREGQPAHMAPEPSLKLDPITSCSRFWNVLTLVMVCPTSSLYRKQTCWNHRRKQACSSCISGWGWKWSARNQLCLIYYTGNSLVALCLVVLTLQGALS